jgi:hypothetical protein
MLILGALALNWIKFQIKLVLILSYNTKVVVWTQMELLDGIVQARRIQLMFGCVCPGMENWLLHTSPRCSSLLMGAGRGRAAHILGKARPPLPQCPSVAH